MKALPKGIAIIGGTLLLFIPQMILTNLGIPANLLLLPVYLTGLRKGYNRGFWTGVAVGFLEDVLTGGILGPSILSKGFTGVVSASIFGRLFIWRPVVGGLTIFILTLVDETIRFTMLALFATAPTVFTEFLVYMIVSGLILIPAGYFIGPEDGK